MIPGTTPEAVGPAGAARLVPLSSWRFHSTLFTDALITLYQLDCSTLGGPIYYFASAEDFDHVITWGGQQYQPLPMEASGFEMTTKGALPQPSVTISNIFGAGNLLLDTYNGLVGADVTRYVTLRRFLDDGSTPDPTAWISRDTFVVAQKTSHTAVAIVFKLAARLDQQGLMLPGRQILRDVCGHVYRFWNGAAFDYSRATCPYTGAASFDVHNNSTTSDHDQCSRSFLGCSQRFGTLPLPARFFPGVGKVR